jgi:hypothetical protein
MPAGREDSSSSFGGRRYVVRDLADKTLSWVEKFKEIGDIAVQCDPGYAALPWAGIQLVLQACLPFIARLTALIAV